jgi:hypothetical protein
MNSSSHDFITVHMRGLKATLVARAQAERVSVSVVVRRAVEKELGCDNERADEAAVDQGSLAPLVVSKLSIRLPSHEAQQFDDAARRAGLSRGAYLAGLLAGVPALQASSPSRLDCLAELMASSAELSSLSRNIHRLAALLRQGDVPAAQEYRRKLEALDEEVRAHLHLAASVLAELRPRQPARAAEPRSPAGQ